MNIKIITCHHVYNYGASLQAYALQSYLESIGNNVSIIDYRLPEHHRYELSWCSPNRRFYKLVCAIPILKYILNPIRNRYMLKTWGRKKAFNRFDLHFLNIETHTYNTYDEIKNNPPVADVFVAGSDQIWNPVMTNGRDRAYYLDFGNKRTKRISYSASFGVKEISFEQGNFVKEQLARFDAISVRESSGVNILNKIGIKSVRTVDPVFLLKSSDWIKQLNLKFLDDNYIFVYDFTHDDKRLEKYVCSLAKKKGLKILAVNDYEYTPYADIQVNNAGPIEFLQYLISAKYVIANSFHAMAFSLIFHKKFVTFPLISQPNPSRMIDLLNSVEQLKHFQPVDLSVIDENINWDTIDKVLSIDVDQSMNYLNNSIINSPLKNQYIV